mmetsp:Transcript_20792/g.62234  ORF Transcript_20792/g.62234 Transcript_20792/m.62234 type:complete len:248 (-) Transcript_20792:1178-1921(-)
MGHHAGRVHQKRAFRPVRARKRQRRADSDALLAGARARAAVEVHTRAPLDQQGEWAMRGRRPETWRVPIHGPAVRARDEWFACAKKQRLLYPREGVGRRCGRLTVGAMALFADGGHVPALGAPRERGLAEQSERQVRGSLHHAGYLADAAARPRFLRPVRRARLRVCRGRLHQGQEDDAVHRRPGGEQHGARQPGRPGPVRGQEHHLQRPVAAQRRPLHHQRRCRAQADVQMLGDLRPPLARGGQGC